METCIIVLKQDEKQKKEFTNRHYDTSEVQGKRKLLSKEEEKAQGYPSPNTADATVLAFTGLTYGDFVQGKISSIVIPQTIPTQASLTNSAGHMQHDNAMYAAVLQAYNDHRKLVASVDGPKVSRSFANSNPITVLQSLY
jgi:hypothetical protein